MSRVICAWCRAVMDRGAGIDDPWVSHGMCPACARAPQAQLDRLVTMWDRLAFEYEPEFGLGRLAESVVVRKSAAS